MASIQKQCKVTVPGNGSIICGNMYANCLYLLKDVYIYSRSAQKHLELGQWAMNEIEVFSKKENKDNNAWDTFRRLTQRKSVAELKLIKAARANASNEEFLQHYAATNGILYAYNITIAYMSAYLMLYLVLILAV